MALEGGKEVSLDTRLTKENVAPPAATSSDNTDISALTGYTRESKAKACATEESKKVSAQYDKLEAMEKKLELSNGSSQKGYEDGRNWKFRR